MDFRALLDAIQRGWGPETTYPKCRDEWNLARPALGQCVVTALVVQDYLGGKIMFSPGNNHFFNIIEGATIDATASQFFFPPDLRDAEEWTRARILCGPRAAAAKTRERYALLSSMVRDRLEKTNAAL